MMFITEQTFKIHIIEEIATPVHIHCILSAAGSCKPHAVQNLNEKVLYETDIIF